MFRSIIAVALFGLACAACNDGTGATQGDVNQAIADHAAQASAHHAKTADAAEITTGTFDDARIPAEVARDTEMQAIVPRRTRLTYTSGIEDTTVTATWELFRTVGTFAKVSADTDVEITLNSHGTASDDFCDWQIRVDDTAPAGNDGRVVLGFAGSATLQGAPLPVRAIFTGLAAGDHTVSLWVRGFAASCFENPGNYPRTVFIDELPIAQ